MYIDEEDILEHLTVSDGKAKYIKSSQGMKSQSKPSSKKSMTEPIEKHVESDNTNEGHYEEHYEEYEEYCIHQKTNVNQGITMCDIDQDVTKCGSCPYRKSQVIRCKVSSASTKISKS